MGRIAIFTDDPGWHGARIRDAFADRGFESSFVSLTECRIFIESGRNPIRIPSFEKALPDGVFVRGVPGGSLEQVIHYLNILHSLKRMGVLVYNDAGAIERSVDKAMTSFLLQLNHLPTPPTWVTPVNSEVLAIARDQLDAGHSLVAKPVFGSQGEGVCKIDSSADLRRLVSSRGVFYLQRYIDNGQPGTSDWRVFVIAGQARSAMRRHGKGWLNNVAQGARCEKVVLDNELRRLAEKAVAALDMNYGGVDIMRDGNGRYTIIEVNSIPAWKGLQSVCNVDVARMLVDDFLNLRQDPGECRTAVSWT